MAVGFESASAASSSRCQVDVEADVQGDDVGATEAVRECRNRSTPATSGMRRTGVRSAS